MDYFKMPYIAYVILIICVVVISFLKLLLSNKLILHTLHKKNYSGNFSIIKASLISLLTEVLVILISLAFFTLIIMSIAHSSVDIVAFLDEFYEMVVGFVLLPGGAGVFPIPTIVVVVFVIMFLTLVNNFTFLRKIDIPERKRNSILNRRYKCTLAPVYSICTFHQDDFLSRRDDLCLTRQLLPLF